MAWSVLVAGLLFVCQGAWAQHYTFRHYGKADGLTNLNVHCLLQIRSGHLLVCTDNGYFRYDGIEFEPFGAADGTSATATYAAAEGERGELWLSAASGLSVIEAGRSVPVPVRARNRHVVLDESAPLIPLDGRRLATLVDGEAQVYASAANGPQAWAVEPLFTNAQRNRLPALSHLGSLYRDQLGAWWAGCGTAICRVGAPAQTAQTTQWGPGEGVPEDTWQTFLRDRQGRVWARGTHHLAVLQPGATSFEVQALDGLDISSLETLNPMAEAPDGSILLRTTGGLSRWRRGRWETLTAANGVDSADIGALLFDRDGNLWLAPTGHGLARWIGYGAFESWTTAQGLDADMIWGVERIGDDLLVGTRDSCTRITPQAPPAVPCGLDGLPAGEIAQFIAMRDGRLWVLLRRGALYERQSGEDRLRLVATLPKTTAMLLDRSRRLWLPSRAGVHSFDFFVPVNVPQTMGDADDYVDVAEDADGGIWSCGSAGLRRHAAGVWVPYTTGDPRDNDGCTSIAAAPDGWIWASTRTRGLLHAHRQGNRYDRWDWIDPPILTSSGLRFVRLDARGRVWVGTGSGVAAYDGRAWRRFGDGDGLIWDDVNQNSFHADADGSVWVGTSGGLTHITDPDTLMRDRPIALHVESAAHNGEPIATASGQRLPRTPHPTIDLRLATFCFDCSANLRIRYRVPEIDDHWIETRQPVMHIATPGSGRYHLEAVAVDSDLQRRSPVLTWQFECLPAWYEVWWLRWSLAALGLAAAWFALHRFASRLQARNAALQRELIERGVLLERATRDTLTGLWNRASALDHLQAAIDRGRRDASLVAVTMIDVDHFKAINDTHGHVAGDSVLRQLAKRLQAGLRSGDTLGRYGGEELLLVMPTLGRRAPAAAVERLCAAVAAEPFVLDGAGPVRVTASFGVAWLEGDETIQQLIARADAALYAAKAGGRNRVVYSTTRTTDDPAAGHNAETMLPTKKTPNPA